MTWTLGQNRGEISPFQTPDGINVHGLIEVISVQVVSTLLRFSSRLIGPIKKFMNANFEPHQTNIYKLKKQ